MNNTTNQITLPAGSTQVVIQTTLKAAAKTAIQAFAFATLLQLVAIMADLQSDVLAGTMPDMEDVNAIGLVMFSGILAAGSAVISFAWNTWFAKTLPANNVVEAEIKP